MSDSTAREMFSAIEAGDLARVRSLVTAEPALVAAIVDHSDALGWAVFYAHPDIVHYFVERGADLNWRTPRGTTPRGFAIKGAAGAFKSHGLDRPEHLYTQCETLLRSAGAVE